MRISEAILEMIDLHAKYGDLEIFATDREGFANKAYISVIEEDEFERSEVDGLGVLID